MTAQATGLALVPVALGMGQPGSEIQAPTAIVIMTGLVSATALNMIARTFRLPPGRARVEDPLRLARRFTTDAQLC